MKVQKLIQLYEHSIQGPRHELLLDQKKLCASESRDLINISWQFVHSQVNNSEVLNFIKKLEAVFAKYLLKGNFKFGS